MNIDAYKDIFGTRKFTSVSKLTPGTVVQFTYDDEQKHAVVLDPNWEGKMHALSLKNISPDDLRKFLIELVQITSKEEIYSRYKNSPYTVNRPYRTYSLTKVSALREVYLKQFERE